VLVLKRDFIRDALEFCSHLGRALVKIFSQGVQVFHVPDLLLLLLNLECANILFKFPLYNSVVILSILESDLSLLLKLCQLV